MVLVEVGDVKGFAEVTKKLNLTGKNGTPSKPNLAAGCDDHSEVALGLIINAARRVTFEQIAEIGTSGRHDR